LFSSVPPDKRCKSTLQCGNIPVFLIISVNSADKESQNKLRTEWKTRSSEEDGFHQNL